ncbi:MAG TPA: MoaD/ThiS family protein [Candidatus Bathyarchaeia archaeon]|nr:MoaD/ThiS family protein [Candidatus Bathyarchaeia archaeon]
MAITVKFVGALRHVSGVDQLALACGKNGSVGIVISEITETRPELKRSLIDQQVQDPRLNALILVNGREISALDGLETKLEDGDELVLIPVAHGG